MLLLRVESPDVIPESHLIKSMKLFLALHLFWELLFNCYNRKQYEQNKRRLRIIVPVKTQP